MTPKKQNNVYEIDGNRIPLRNKHGKVIAFALVDDEDYERVNVYRWSLASNGKPVRTTSQNGESITIYLSRDVLGLTDRNMWVRPINKDRLDCRKHNLIVKKADKLSWRDKDPTKRRDFMRRYVYGLERNDYESILAKQNYECGICGKDISEKHDVDHCHKTGKVRGLLCRGCNLGIRKFERDRNWLSKALKYLEE